MNVKHFFVVLLFLAMLRVSVQDGFNFYKALNRTPIGRIERFNRDGFSRAFKVPLPLAKRLLYDDSKSEPIIHSDQQNDEEVLSIFLNWFPRSSKSNELKSTERNPKHCIDVKDVYSNLNE